MAPNKGGNDAQGSPTPEASASDTTPQHHHATGESLEKPNLQKLIKALKWHQENRPDWKVLIFIYEAPSWWDFNLLSNLAYLFMSTTYHISMF